MLFDYTDNHVSSFYMSPPFRCNFSYIYTYNTIMFDLFTIINKINIFIGEIKRFLEIFRAEIDWKWKKTRNFYNLWYYGIPCHISDIYLKFFWINSHFMKRYWISFLVCVANLKSKWIACSDPTKLPWLRWGNEHSSALARQFCRITTICSLIGSLAQ